MPHLYCATWRKAELSQAPDFFPNWKGHHLMQYGHIDSFTFGSIVFDLITEIRT
jgi:hypothetical protein